MAFLQRRAEAVDQGTARKNGNDPDATSHRPRRESPGPGVQAAGTRARTTGRNYGRIRGNEMTLTSQLNTLSKLMRLNRRIGKRKVMELSEVKRHLTANNSYYVNYALQVIDIMSELFNEVKQ